MEVFYSTMGFIAAVVIGIIAIALFFMAVGWIRRLPGDPAVVKINKLLNKVERINIHLKNGKMLDRVKFVGFADSGSASGGHIPYQLAGMVVLEHSNGKRVLIRADLIQMIEEAE